MSNVTRRQHYVPKSVLRNFSSDGKQIYEGRMLTTNCYKTNINNSMCERNIYEHKLLETNAIERFFALTIDSDLALFTREFLNIFESDGKGIVEESFRCVSKHMQTVLLCYFRSGAILEEYNTAFKRDKGQVIIRILSKISPKYINALRSTILSQYQYAVLKNNDIGFIIGDQYMATCALRIKSNFSNASNRQIGQKDTLILLPISSTYCVAFFHGDKPDYVNSNSLCELTNAEVKQINQAICNSSYKKIAGENGHLITELLKSASKITSRYLSPITCVSTYESGATTGFVNKKEVFFYQRDYDAFNLFHTFKFDVKMGRNSLCYCGSGKKHKNCCIEKTEIIKEMIKTFRNQSDKSNPFAITQKTFCEESIQIPKYEYEQFTEVLKK